MIVRSNGSPNRGQVGRQFAASVCDDLRGRSRLLDRSQKGRCGRGSACRRDRPGGEAQTALVPTLRASSRVPVTIVAHDCPSVPAPPQPPSGLSPFAARVLSQLAVTAWLPAALLMADVYLVLGLFMVRPAHGTATADNLKRVVATLNAKPVGVIIAVVLGMFVATLITQSLGFAAIRFLEGYWGGSLAAAMPTKIGVGIQRARQWLLMRRADKLDGAAFRAAAPAVRLRLHDDVQLGLAVDTLGRGWPAAGIDEEVLERARAYLRKGEWRVLAPAHLRHRLSAVETRLSRFPAKSRMMPSRFGNTLRVAEDALHGDVVGSRLRGWVMRHLTEIDPLQLEQLDMYHDRLEMYAVMTPMCLGLAVLDAAALPYTIPGSTTALFAAGFVLLSAFCYRGAVSTAIDYGIALQTANKAVRTKDAG